MIEAHFLEAQLGRRFAVVHSPSPGTPLRGAVVFAPPFAEEMNKSRRMVALQARRLAAMGYGVVIVDLLGCGDSSGDFADARWERWKDDMALATDHAAARFAAPLSVWGLRLGGLLAADYAATTGAPAFERVVLWQPVTAGETYLTQFLRIQVASQMLAGAAEAKSGTAALRARLQAGEPVEIAGYALAPELAAAIDGLKLAEIPPPACPVQWLEIGSGASSGLSPATRRAADAWRERGARVEAHALQGEPFWSTVEIALAPTLLDATDRVFSGH